MAGNCERGLTIKEGGLGVGGIIYWITRINHIYPIPKNKISGAQ